MNRFTKAFADANAAFDAQYANELKQLKGLSTEEINAILPDTNSAQVYQELISLVEKASKENMAQAQLISNIKKLGDVAIKIAKKIPGFDKLL